LQVERAASHSRAGIPHRDWTKGSIFGNLMALSWPMLVSSSLNMLGPTIDMIWIGKLGAASIAGVGVSAIAIMVVNSLMTGLFAGTAALVARFMGAHDVPNANRAAQQAFVIGFVYSVILAMVGIFLADRILMVLGVAPDVVAQGAAYMRVQLVGIVTMGAIMAGQSIMNASGDTRTPMKISLTYRLMHIALSPCLIFGIWIFPKLGVTGAALSNVISQSVGGALAMWILFSGKTRIKLTLNGFSLDRNIVWRTLKIGFPASITAVERSFSDLVLVRFIIPFGTVAVAAHSVAQRIDQFVQMPCGALGQSAGVLAGQNLGARQPERASRTGWIAAGLSVAFTVACSIAIWFFAENMLSIFTTQSSVVGIASTFLRIQIAGYIFWGAVIALSMCLNGAGDTLITMVTNLTAMWGFAITLAFILSRFTPLGVNGIRWAMVAGIMVRMAIYGIYFKSGRWLRRQV
jgi:putative MATE family efflux protein